MFFSYIVKHILKPWGGMHSKPLAGIKVVFSKVSAVVTVLPEALSALVPLNVFFSILDFWVAVLPN